MDFPAEGGRTQGAWFGPVDFAGVADPWTGFTREELDNSKIVSTNAWKVPSGALHDKVLLLDTQGERLSYATPLLGTIPAKVSVSVRMWIWDGGEITSVADADAGCGVSIYTDREASEDGEICVILYCRTDDGPGWVRVGAPGFVPETSERFYDIRLDLAFPSSGEPTVSLSVDGHVLGDATGRTAFPLAVADAARKVVSGIYFEEIGYVDSFGGDVQWAPDWFPGEARFTERMREALSASAAPVRFGGDKFMLDFPAPYAGTYRLLGAGSPDGEFRPVGEKRTVAAAGDPVNLADTNAVGEAKFYRVRFSDRPD